MLKLPPSLTLSTPMLTLGPSGLSWICLMYFSSLLLSSCRLMPPWLLLWVRTVLLTSDSSSLELELLDSLLFFLVMLVLPLLVNAVAPAATLLLLL